MCDRNLRTTGKWKHDADGELLLASTYWHAVKIHKSQAATLMINCLPKPAQTPCFCLYKSDQTQGSLIEYVCLLCTEQVTLGVNYIHSPRWLSGRCDTGAGAKAKWWVCYVRMQHGVFLDSLYAGNVFADEKRSCIESVWCSCYIDLMTYKIVTN